MRFSKTLLGLIGFVTLGTATAFAQVEVPSQISIQGTALITKSTKDTTPSNDVIKTGGFLLGYSYQINSWAGVEGNYGYTRNTHNYFGLTSNTSLQSDFHEITGSFVAHIPSKVRNVRPYALAGGGALVFNPTDKIVVSGTDQQTRAAFVYGGGVNFDVTNNFGVRTEYRGLLYKVPDFGLNSLNIDKFTHLAQPSVGFFFRF